MRENLMSAHGGAGKRAGGKGRVQSLRWGVNGEDLEDEGGGGSHWALATPFLAPIWGATSSSLGVWLPKANAQ